MGRCCLFLGTIVLLWLVNRFTMKTFAQISSEAESNDGVAYHGDATVALPSMGGNQLEDLAAQGKHDEELRMEEVKHCPMTAADPAVTRRRDTDY